MKFKNLFVLFIFSLAAITSTIQFARPIDEAVEGSLAYAYIYNKKLSAEEKSAYMGGTQKIAIKVGEDVTFDAHGPIAGIQHEIGSSEIIFDNDGVYTINFLTVSNGNGPIYELFLNDKLIEGSPYGFFGVASVEKSGQSIIEAKSGDKLSLRLYSALNKNKPVSLRASIMIMQIA